MAHPPRTLRSSQRMATSNMDSNMTSLNSTHSNTHSNIHSSTPRRRYRCIVDISSHSSRSKGSLK